MGGQDEPCSLTQGWEPPACLLRLAANQESKLANEQDNFKRDKCSEGKERGSMLMSLNVDGTSTCWYCQSLHRMCGSDGAAIPLFFLGTQAGGIIQALIW